MDIFVPHHVEEVMPVFSHALILKNGGRLASGKKTAGLTGKNLSAAFAARARVRWQSGRPVMTLLFSDFSRLV